MGFLNLVEEVFRLLLAYMFPRKTEEFWEGTGQYLPLSWKLVKLRYYQAHNKFIPTASASVLDPDANRLGMSLTGSYPVKISAIKDLETLS